MRHVNRTSLQCAAVAVGLVVSQFSFAASSSELQNLNYLTPTSKWTLQTGFMKPLHEVRRTHQNTPKVDFGGIERTAFDWTFGADYGIADNMTLGLAFDYLVFQHDSTVVDKANYLVSTRATTKGLSDPTINFVYRYMASDWIGDGFARLKPSLKKKEYAGGTFVGGGQYGSSIGNNVSGSTDLSVGSKMTTESGNLEFGVTPALTYHTAAKFMQRDVFLALPTTVDSNGETDAYITANAQLNARHHYNKDLYAQAGANLVAPHTINSKVTGTITTAGSSTTTATATNPDVLKTSIPFHITPSVNFGYKWTSNLLVDLGFTYDRYGAGIQNTNGTTGANKGQSMTQELTSLTGALNFSYQM